MPMDAIDNKQSGTVTQSGAQAQFKTKPPRELGERIARKLAPLLRPLKATSASRSAHSRWQPLRLKLRFQLHGSPNQ